VPGKGYRFLANAVPADASGAEDPARATIEADLRRTPAIAVLPFVNLSPSIENEHFADGLTDELIHQVASIPGFRVAGRTSSFQFKGKVEDLRRIGDQLKVDMLVEGSVRREGQHLLITVQLISAADGLHIWSGRYQHEMREIFVIQSEIGNAIAQTLRVRLPLPGWGQVSGRHTKTLSVTPCSCRPRPGQTNALAKGCSADGKSFSEHYHYSQTMRRRWRG